MSYACLVLQGAQQSYEFTYNDLQQSLTAVTHNGSQEAFLPTLQMSQHMIPPIMMQQELLQKAVAQHPRVVKQQTPW